jgi:acetylcholinesterase
VDYPNTLYRTGRFAEVPMITSDDTNEGTGFMTNASTPFQVSEFPSLQLPHLTPLQLAAINALYPLESPLPMHAACFPSLTQAYGEAVFICPGLEIAAYQSLYNSIAKIWNYRYNVEDLIDIALGYGVPHVSENAAIFGVGPTGSGIGVGRSYTTYNAPIVPIIMDYFIKFVKFLDLNGQGNQDLTKWENLGFGFKQRRLLFELVNITMEDVPVAQLKRCLLWDSATQQIEI